MLPTLFNRNGDQAFADAMEAVRQSYLTGQYAVNGQSHKLPYTKQLNDLFGRLAGKTPEELKAIEYRDALGNLSHFTNVVAAMAHIVTYAEKHMDKLLPKGENDVERVFSPQRRLDIMMIAYYHDIGKAIIPRRHAMGGKYLLAEPKASVRFRFEQIFSAYKECRISPGKLSLYSETIGAHDLIGTMGTGENGTLSMSGVVLRFKDLFNGDKAKVKTAVFDLWLLNVADIIVSINNFTPGYSKFMKQPWQWAQPGHMDGKIEELLGFAASKYSFQGEYLNEDLRFALQIADSYDSYGFAKNLAEKQAAHRFRRLARQTLGNSVENGAALSKTLKDKVIKVLDDDAAIASVKEILRGEFGDDYGRRFGMMLQFDYALGFFNKLSERAVEWLGIELTEKTFRTGWLYNQKVPKGGGYHDDFLDSYNAECIVNNYIMVLAGIFGEIYRLTADIESWNIEFEDARSRLDNSKADKLLFFDGAYRAGNARVSLMREIMLYKA
ncbi:MAG: hypothetical protein LBS19_12375 [Clostridiales bacterium]|jgi:hypothetical protein|nr:hypothetical protein [Clostridiales bacterium]